MLKFLNEKLIKKIKENKLKLDKGSLSKSALAVGVESLALVMLLTGCGAENTVTPGDVTTTEPDSSQVTTETTEVPTTEIPSTTLVVGADDTFVEVDWAEFVEENIKNIKGKINTDNNVSFEMALAVLNIEYLSKNGENVLVEQFSRSEDLEGIFNVQADLASQIREWNTTISSSDSYISYSDFMLLESDKNIISKLDGYLKEVITLSKDLTDENKKKIQNIFDIVLAFVDGTGTIEVKIAGKIEKFSKSDLSRGAVFAADNIAQTISVMSKEVVSQQERKQLKNELNSNENLLKVQELVVKYTTIATIDGVDSDLQTQIFDIYSKSFSVVKDELIAIGLTEDEAKSLYTLINIDYFVNSLESQNIFDLIYTDGIGIDAMFELAESAVSKIVQYNDSKEKSADIYDMARLVFDDTDDAVSLRAFAQNAYNIKSKDEAVATNAIGIVKGYSQYSSDVTVDYQTKDADGNVVEHSLDKKALSKGATQVINWYTYYSVLNHKSVYGESASEIIVLVDGSQDELSPYSSIVSMIEDYCALRNIIVYDYSTGVKSGEQK